MACRSVHQAPGHKPGHQVVRPAGHAVSRHVQSGGCWAASQAGRDPRSAPRLARNRLGTGWPGPLGVRCRARAKNGRASRRTARGPYSTRLARFGLSGRLGRLERLGWLGRLLVPAYCAGRTGPRATVRDGSCKSEAGGPSLAGPPPVRFGTRRRPTDRHQGRLEPATRPAGCLCIRRRLPAFAGRARGQLPAETPPWPGAPRARAHGHPPDLVSLAGEALIRACFVFRVFLSLAPGRDGLLSRRHWQRDCMSSCAESPGHAKQVEYPLD